MNWLYILLCAILVLIVYWYYLFFKYKSAYVKYHGPPYLPVMGHLHNFRNVNDLISVLMQMNKQYGPNLKLWFGYRPRLIISDYKMAEIILGSTTTIDKAYDYDYFKPWLGTGLLTSSGSKWKQQRKLLTPAFHFSILEQFIAIFNTQSELLVKKLLSIDYSRPFDVFPFINLLALDVICEATMGTQVHAQIESESSYVCSVREMCRIVFVRSVSLPKMFNNIYRFSRDYRKEKKALSVLHGYSNSVIKSRQEELMTAEAENPDTLSDPGSGIKNRLAFLDILLKSKVNGAQLPLDVIREEVDTFMFEGHDTTTSAISFTLYCLSTHLEVQNRVFNEIQSIIGNDKDSTATYQNLQDMKYLEMVIKESLRLYPSVPFFGRNLKEGLLFDCVKLPLRTTAFIFVYGLHRQEEIYPDPEKFDPERFTAENCNKRCAFAYVPFSAGPRNCIGQRFALLEVKSVVSKILKTFEILPVSEYKPKLIPEAILKSANGVMIRLRKRES